MPRYSRFSRSYRKRGSASRTITIRVSAGGRSTRPRSRAPRRRYY